MNSPVGRLDEPMFNTKFPYKSLKTKSFGGYGYFQATRINYIENES